MTRLTTPLHLFEFDTDPSEYRRLVITYAQGLRTVLEKEKDDLVITEETADGVTKWTAELRLTQEETKRFLPRDGEVRLQVRALTAAGEALASGIMKLTLEDVLNEEVLT